MYTRLLSKDIHMSKRDMYLGGEREREGERERQRDRGRETERERKGLREPVKP